MPRRAAALLAALLEALLPSACGQTFGNSNMPVVPIAAYISCESSCSGFLAALGHPKDSLADWSQAGCCLVQYPVRNADASTLLACSTSRRAFRCTPLGTHNLTVTRQALSARPCCLPAVAVAGLVFLLILILLLLKYRRSMHMWWRREQVCGGMAGCCRVCCSHVVAVGITGSFECCCTLAGTGFAKWGAALCALSHMCRRGRRSCSGWSAMQQASSPALLLLRRCKVGSYSPMPGMSTLLRVASYLAPPHAHATTAPVQKMRHGS